ncbi:MAG: mechanosensitive ion channel family protein [Micrococcales bacterium]
MPSWLLDFYNNWHVLIKVVLIIVGALVGRWILLFFVKRVVRGITASVKNSPLAQERVVQRAHTMGSVLRNLITWSITIVAIIMLLSAIGIDVTAFVAAAGLIGAGLGFGSQALIRDLISGLFIVFEDQFGVGDTVNLGEITGVVEGVGLRATQVRDDNGVLWYVRNGEIVRVGNLSQGWSTATVDVALAGKTDWLKAKTVIEKAAAKVNKSNQDKVLGEAKVWAIHALSGDQTVLRVNQQTKATLADDIARALRVEIKTSLDTAKLALAASSTVIIENRK